VAALAAVLYDSVILLDYFGIIHTIGGITNLNHNTGYVINTLVFFGGLILLIGTLADFITSQLLVKEREALATAQALAAAQSIAKIGSWEWDIAKQTMICSDEFYRIYNLSKHRKGLSYQMILDRIHPHDKALVSRKLQQTIDQGKPFHLEHRINTTKTQTKYIRAEARMQYDKHGRPFKILGTSQDITAQKALDNAKNEFVALASHQLRTPATGVEMLLSLLKEGYSGSMDASQLEVVEQAYDANERQLRIINNVLSVPQLDAKRIELKRKPISAKEVLSKVLQDHATLLKDRGQSIQTQFTIQPAMVLADPIYLYIALDNLVSNASKYSPVNSTIHAVLGVERKLVTISITDSGVGIDKHMARHVYEKFKRLKNAYTDQTEGSGMRLYLTKNIVEMHKGTIHFVSTPGNSTTFTIELPLAAATKTSNNHE
jgi:signal transduction histidine kinase